jgi:hypothetical protein
MVGLYRPAQLRRGNNSTLQAADKRLLNRMENTLYWRDIAKVPGP